MYNSGVERLVEEMQKLQVNRSMVVDREPERSDDSKATARARADTTEGVCLYTSKKEEEEECK